MPTQHETPTVLQRMSDAINAHDVDALVSCFTNDYQANNRCISIAPSAV